MIEITSKPISPERTIESAKTNSSGCVATYVGLIRDYSRNRSVLQVEYEDPQGTAQGKLKEIATEASHRWRLNNVAISHRIGKLNVGEINLVICVASAHRKDGLAACGYLIDRFKEVMPTRKKETYTDGTIWATSE